MYCDYMTRKMTATEAKARLLAVLDEVAAGQVIEITKRGKVVAQLTPVRNIISMRDALKGVATTAAPDDDLYSTGLEWNAQ